MNWRQLIRKAKGNEDISETVAVFSDHEVRSEWFSYIFDEIEAINESLDRLLLKDKTDPKDFIVLAARRKTLNWVLDQIVRANESVHNP